jgi:hypothetical protein
MKKTKSDSPALAFVRLAWDCACTGVPHAWLPYNQAVRTAAHLAAESFRWATGDIDEMWMLRNSRYGIWKCLGENGLETLYTLAVRSGNRTFCEEYERFTGRPPIIADDVNDRQKDRLCVGSKFTWKGEQVEVTSFAKDGAAVACSYTEIRPAEVCPTCRCFRSMGKTKILHRYRITRDDVIADRKERNDREKRRPGTDSATV